MANRVFSTLDLVRLIYSFGEPTHRKFTCELSMDLKPCPEECISRFLDRRITSGRCYTLQSFMNEYSTEHLEKMLFTYKRCYCCARHNHNKPMLIRGIETVPVQSVFESHPEECECSCRQLSRKCIKALKLRETALKIREWLFCDLDKVG
jgi:hypothetical protein